MSKKNSKLGVILLLLSMLTTPLSADETQTIPAEENKQTEYNIELLDNITLQSMMFVVGLDKELSSELIKLIPSESDFAEELELYLKEEIIVFTSGEEKADKKSYTDDQWAFFAISQLLSLSDQMGALINSDEELKIEFFQYLKENYTKESTIRDLIANDLAIQSPERNEKNRLAEERQTQRKIGEFTANEMIFAMACNRDFAARVMELIPFESDFDKELAKSLYGFFKNPRDMALPQPYDTNQLLLALIAEKESYCITMLDIIFATQGFTSEMYGYLRDNYGDYNDYVKAFTELLENALDLENYIPNTASIEGMPPSGNETVLLDVTRNPDGTYKVAGLPHGALAVTNAVKRPAGALQEPELKANYGTTVAIPNGNYTFLHDILNKRLHIGRI